MIALAHAVAIVLYLAAAGLAAIPFARPIRAPVRSVVWVLAAGIAIHAAALVQFVRIHDEPPLTGLGPALSFAALLVAVTLLVVEVLAREVSLTLFAAPLAALLTGFASLAGMVPGPEANGMRGVWLTSHIALSFLGIAAFATAAAAGVMYLVERRELKSRRFGAIFRFFPPLATLDRVNHVAAIAGWLGLTLGVVLAGAYSIAYREMNLPQLMWGTGAWVAVSGIAIGRVIGGWQARRAAVYSSITFIAVLVLYVAIRVAGPAAGKFL